MWPKPLSIFLALPFAFALTTGGAAYGASTADLYKKMSQLYSAENEFAFSPCDFRDRDKVLEVTRALQLKQREIQNFTQRNFSAPASGSYVAVGNFQFSKSFEPEALANRWITEPTSWSAIYESYLSVKGTPVDRYWVSLNQLVRGLVQDEDMRLDDLRFRGVHRDSGPLILQIERQILACEANPVCMNPQLSKEQKAFLTASGNYKKWIADFESPQVSEKIKRKSLQSLRRVVVMDAEVFHFAVNPAARVEGHTLVIPLDVSAFGKGAPQAIAWIEKTWNIDPEYRLRIQSVQNNPAAYKIQVNQQAGGRAGVDAASRTLTLYNYGTLKTIAHEFGHVLGFSDNYFSSWSNDTCSYSLESNPGDIMSDQKTGIVLPEHWEQLKKVYWKQNNSPRERVRP